MSACMYERVFRRQSGSVAASTTSSLYHHPEIQWRNNNQTYLNKSTNQVNNAIKHRTEYSMHMHQETMWDPDQPMAIDLSYASNGAYKYNTVDAANENHQATATYNSGTRTMNRREDEGDSSHDGLTLQQDLLMSEHVNIEELRRIEIWKTV
ncbi:hypothetical protein PV327_011611, partial [Microctonus hyperodae]